MKVRYGEEMANHSGLESCRNARRGVAEALTGETDRPGIEPRNQDYRMPTWLRDVEGNTKQGVNRKSCNDPRRSKTPSMSGGLLYRSWEISSVPVPQGAGGAGKANSRNPASNAGEKSDTSVVSGKPPNKGVHPAQVVEGRGVAKGNANKIPAPRIDSRLVVRRWVLRMYARRLAGIGGCGSGGCCSRSRRHFWQGAPMLLSTMRR